MGWKEKLEEFKNTTAHSAYPIKINLDESGSWAISPGLSKREYFAAKILNGFIPNLGIHKEPNEYMQLVVEQSVMMADLLIQQLAKPVE